MGRKDGNSQQVIEIVGRKRLLRWVFAHTGQIRHQTGRNLAYKRENAIR
jgi:hypothetical protein